MAGSSPELWYEEKIPSKLRFLYVWLDLSNYSELIMAELVA
jgi:hypothetical protein